MAGRPQPGPTRGRVWAVLLPVVAVLVAGGCAGGDQTPKGPMTWTGARALTGTEDAPHGVATDGARVLFTTGRTMVGENAVRSVALDGDTASVVVATMPAGRIPNGLMALDGDVAYVAAGSGIVRLPLAGGDATVVVDGRPAGVEDVVVAGDALWWTTSQYLAPKRIEIARMPKAGGAVEAVATGVAASLGDPYVEGDSALVASPQGVLRVRAGSAPEVVVSSDVAGGAVTALAVDDQRLYLLVAGSRHRLLAVPRGGGAPTVLAPDVDSTASVVVVGDQVVFFGPSGPVGSGRATLQAVAGAGGTPRTIAAGRYSDGDLAAVGTDRVVFSADDRVWVAEVT